MGDAEFQVSQSYKVLCSKSNFTSPDISCAKFSCYTKGKTKVNWKYVENHFYQLDSVQNWAKIVQNYDLNIIPINGNLKKVYYKCEKIQLFYDILRLSNSNLW